MPTPENPLYHITCRSVLGLVREPMFRSAGKRMSRAARRPKATPDGSRFCQMSSGEVPGQAGRAVEIRSCHRRNRRIRGSAQTSWPNAPPKHYSRIRVDSHFDLDRSGNPHWGVRRHISMFRIRIHTRKLSVPELPPPPSPCTQRDRVRCRESAEKW